MEPQILAGEGNGAAQMDTDPSPEPHEGMEFDSEESARSFYSSYARAAGFRIRISRYTRSRRDNSIISRLIVCSKEGFREPRNGTETPLRQRAVTRVGCKAMLMVKKLSPGKWVVTKFVKDHNHGPVPPRRVEVRVLDNDSAAERSNFSSDSGDGREVLEPFEGMEFETEEDAKSYYIDYARQIGFRARISKYCRSRRDNSIISRQIVCSKEGFREVRMKKEETEDGRVKRPRVVTRIGCKAMINVKRMSTGKWVVSRFEREHNHTLVGSSQASHEDCEKSLVNYEGRPNIVDSGEGVAVMGSGGCRESLTVLYNQLCYEAIKYAQEGAVSEEIYNVAMSALKEAVEKVAAAKRSATPVSRQGSKQTGKELVLMPQPLRFVLIPSASLANESTPGSNVVDSSVILSIPNNSQGNTVSSLVSDSKDLSPDKQSVEGLVSDGISKHDGVVQNSQKLDNVDISHAKAIPESRSNLVNPRMPEAQMVAVPALPVTLYMPVVGNFSEASSGTPGSNTYTLIAAPVEALSGSGHPAAELGSQTAADHHYTGPNPQVHATAIAAGARIVPPQEAASLIKAIEARVRTAKSVLASGCKESPPIAAWSPPPCSSLEGQKALDMAQAHGNASEGMGAVTSDEGMQLHRPVEGSSEIEVGMVSNSLTNDNACEDHLFSDGGS